MDSAIHGICGIRLDGERLDGAAFRDVVVNDRNGGVYERDEIGKWVGEGQGAG